MVKNNFRGRLLSIILVISLLVGLPIFGTVLAAASSSATATLTIETKNAKPNENVTLAITPSGDSNWGAAQMALDYDHTKLELVSIEKGSVKSDTEPTEAKPNDNVNALFVSEINPQKEGQAPTIAYINTEASKIEGSFANCTFKVSSTTENEKINVGLKDIRLDGVTKSVSGKEDTTYSITPTVIAGTITVISEESPANKKGDVDGDGSITSGDAYCILKIDVGLDPMPIGDQFKIADVDGDGFITSGDSYCILRIDVGLDPIPNW